MEQETALIIKELIKGKVKTNELMSLHTSFKVGGPADFFVEPADLFDLQKILSFSSRYRFPILILGKGTNVLVKDGGFRGLVIHMGKAFNYCNIINTELRAGAGIHLPLLVNESANQGLTGLEFACGIPGSLGGGIYMNAGAYEETLGNLLKKVKVISREGNISLLSEESLFFGYRWSIFQDTDDIIIEGTFQLSNGNRKDILNTITELNRKRKKVQPLFPNAGSVFRNPKRVPAGLLLEKAGVKGLKQGGARVSTRHANFIENIGNATASDILSLIDILKEEVYKQFKINMELELRVVGED